MVLTPFVHILSLIPPGIPASVLSFSPAAKLVPVDYTLVKNLKKPPSAPPGKVIYHVYYSVNVTPDREKIEKMQIQK